MVVTCLAITGIIAVSKFYTPKYSIKTTKMAGQDVCEGYIDSSPLWREDGGLKLTVALDGCSEGYEMKPRKGRVQLTVGNGRGEGEVAFSYGDVVRFMTHLREPTDFKNPGAFKFKRYCLSRKISALGYIDDPAWIKKIGIVSGHPVRLAIESIRERIANSLDAISDPDLRSVARALLIGDGSHIAEKTKEDFRRSGLMHILVISGLNVGFVALAVFFVIKWLLVLPAGLAARVNIFKPAAAVTIAAVWLYAYITGAEVSVTRAAIMATVYLAGICIDKRQDVFTSLALAALIILADSPLAIYDISFQLSFITVLTIALIYPRLAEKFSGYQKFKRYLFQAIAVSIAATIGAAPLIAYYFHYSSLIGIIANIFAVPWAGFVITPLSLIVGLIAAISPPLAATPAILWSYLIIPLAKIAEFTAQISAPFIIALTPPKLTVLMFYHVMIFVSLKKYLRYASIAIALCSVVLIGGFALQRGWFMPNRLEVIFLDVGQGSSAVIKFPTGKVMIIDGGGNAKSQFDIGKFVIAPYLWHRGISKVDWLIATHAHPDHYKGLGFLAEEFHPNEFWWNGAEPEEEEKEEWNAFIERIKPFVRPELVEARKFNEGGVSVEFLSPPSEIPAHWNINDTSIVTRITYGEKSFLFTGDIEADAEENLVKQLRGASDGRETILQVPHHGSSSSSTRGFLETIRPKIAVIQAGENNRYGFPTEGVLTRLKDVGAEIKRTDQDGAIEFKF